MCVVTKWRAEEGGSVSAIDFEKILDIVKCIIGEGMVKGVTKKGEEHWRVKPRVSSRFPAESRDSRWVAENRESWVPPHLKSVLVQ
jgi:hypothetical protein